MNEAMEIEKAADLVVDLQPTVMFSFDGATTIAASGNSFAEGDLFTNTKKDDMSTFLNRHSANGDPSCHPSRTRG